MAVCALTRLGDLSIPCPAGSARRRNLSADAIQGMSAWLSGRGKRRFVLPQSGDAPAVAMPPLCLCELARRREESLTGAALVGLSK